MQTVPPILIVLRDGREQTLTLDAQAALAFATQAAQRFGIAQSRVSDLVRGKWDKFSLDMLITLAARAGQKVVLEMHA